MTAEEFIGESLQPCAGPTGSPGMIAAGPVVPGCFLWRGQRHEVAEVKRVWKESGPMKGGGPEMYLRKHWFEIRTRDDLVMTVYFERQARSKGDDKRRWWLYTIRRPESEQG